MPGYERLSPSSNGGDDAQVFPDCCCCFVCHDGSCRAGRHCGQCRCQGSRSEPAVVGAASRRQRSGGKTSSRDSAEDGNAKTDDDAKADGHAERNAATPDTHAPSFRTTQVQTKAALRVSLEPFSVSIEGRRKLARDQWRVVALALFVRSGKFVGI